MSEARSRSSSPPCAADGGQDIMAVFAAGRGGGFLITSYRGTPLTAPLIRTITSWGLGQVRRKVSHVLKI